MERRKFLGLSSLAGLSLLSFPSPGFSVCIPGWHPAVESYPLLPEFLPKEFIWAIGKGYLELDPGFTDTKFAALGRGPLAQWVQADFEKDNTLVVAGWVLSRTEAQHCAFLYRKNK